MKQEATEKKTKPLKHGLLNKSPPSIKDRGIDASTIGKYKVTTGSKLEDDIEAIFPRFDNDGNHIANQVRYSAKRFICEGKISKAGLFGKTFFSSVGRTITETEGK